MVSKFMNLIVSEASKWLIFPKPDGMTIRKLETRKKKQFQKFLDNQEHNILRLSVFNSSKKKEPHVIDY